MAIKKSSGTAKKAVNAVSGKISSKFRWLKRFLFAAFFIMLGGVIFNLDRSGKLGLILLQYKNFIPYTIAKFLPGGTASEGAAIPEAILNGRIIEVHDGDTATLFVESTNKKYRIRFYAIDAPEISQTDGTLSQAGLKKKILGQDVEVRVVAVDQYKRAVGLVKLGVRNINLEMVADGFAWYYEDYAKNELDYANAQLKARFDRLGIWKEKKPTPPWEYRRVNKKQR
jgi:endonuclease YncB( thermonuclease family)